MVTKQLKTGLWIVDYEHINGDRIEVFNSYKEAEDFMINKYNYMTFLTRLKRLL